MFLVFGTIGNPCAQQFGFLGRELLSRLGGRHLCVGIGGQNAFQQFAFFRFAGNDGTRFSRRGGIVKSQTSLATRGVRPVAGEAFVGQYRQNITGERHRVGTANKQDSRDCERNHGLIPQT